MTYTHSKEKDALIITLEGDLLGEEDHHELISKVGSFVEEGGRKALVNISDVRYINSSGIGILITLLTKLRNRDGELCLVNPSESVSKLLIITKLQAIFKVATSLQEGLDLLQTK